MELDIKKLKRQIEEIEGSIAEIRKYVKVSEDDFWKDRRNVLAVEQLLLRIIEACGSICLHIIAKKLRKGADNIAQCFDILYENKLIKPELSKKLIKMARFRNILIHRYWEIDEKKIYEYAKNNLRDVEDFISFIKQYL